MYDFCEWAVIHHRSIIIILFAAVCMSALRQPAQHEAHTCTRARTHRQLPMHACTLLACTHMHYTCTHVHHRARAHARTHHVARATKHHTHIHHEAPRAHMRAVMHAHILVQHQATCTHARARAHLLCCANRGTLRTHHVRYMCKACSMCTRAPSGFTPFYAAILAIGGITGYATKGSLPSLGAGVGSGLLLAILTTWR